LQNTFICLSRDDPTHGFLCDASQFAGNVCGEAGPPEADGEPALYDNLRLRLVLGSHLAQYLRLQLEEQKGYTATVGVSTNKLLSKLVGNVNKPRTQTTLAPPYSTENALPSNVTKFVDSHEIGRIPGIGFKMAQKLREHYLQRPVPAQDMQDMVYVKEKVTVHQVRTMPEMSAALLDKLLGGPGWPADIGYKAWALMHGVDDTEVEYVREIPKQISQEDSYTRLDTYDDVIRELKILSRSLVRRMRIDLVEDEEGGGGSTSKRWLAHPRTIRLSTRPRGAPDTVSGFRSRALQRISRSAPLPNFVFGLFDSVEEVADRLVDDTLVPLFRKLHQEQSSWNLSLLNIAVTNMAEAASDSKTASGRDIGSMFKHQEENLREWKVEDRDVPPDIAPPLVSQDLDGWLSDEVPDDEDHVLLTCPTCGAQILPFAVAAHQRFHETGE